MKLAMKNVFFTIGIILFLGSYALAQNPTDYAKKVVEVLSSDELAGRGYVNNGLSHAENEIVGQYEKIGLLKFGNSYLQPISYPINIVKNASLSLNGKELRLGVDFIPSGFSKSDSGTLEADYFNPSVIDSAFMYEDLEDFYNEIDRLSGKAVVFPTVEFPANLVSDGFSANDMYREAKHSFEDQVFGENNKVLIELTPTKLTYGLSNQPKDTHLFTVMESAAPEHISTVSYSIESELNSHFTSHNIIGFIPGKDTSQKVVITAHYDHLGQIGNAIFPGANDNASGIAMLLSLAKYYSQNPPPLTLVFIAFTGEEAGLRGSKYFVEHPLFDLQDIKLVMNFDIMGTGDEGIQVVNSAKYPKIYQYLEFINTKHTLLKNVKKRGEACNSDHCPFDEKGIPAIFTYTLGGAPYYHDINDTAENLSLLEFEDVFHLYTIYINEYLKESL